MEHIDPSVDMVPQGTPGAVPEEDGHERSDVGLRGILTFGVALLVTIVLVMVVLAGWYAALARKERMRLQESPSRFADDRDHFPEPILQGSPAADMVLLRERDEAQLAGYAWVDREAKIARLPIDRAMELTLPRLKVEEAQRPTAGAESAGGQGSTAPAEGRGSAVPERPSSDTDRELPADPFEGPADGDSSNGS